MEKIHREYTNRKKNLVNLLRNTMENEKNNGKAEAIWSTQ